MEVVDLFNYKTSWLNPGLKWFAPFLFLIACAFLFGAYARYGGVFKVA